MIQRIKWPLAGSLVALCLFSATAFSTRNVAYAAQPDMRPSVLLVDSSLGDESLFRLHWMGEDVEEVGAEGTMRLEISAHPAWWYEKEDASQAEAPATFFLYDSEQNPLTADQIVWALDQIYTSDFQSKVVIVSVGTTGLQVRRYVQDFADVKQSDRADVVGLMFMGTPHKGYSEIENFPTSGLWQYLTTAADLTVEEVQPGSAFLEDLNNKPFPGVVKSLGLRGTARDFGFGMSDGAGIEDDFSMPSTVTTQLAITGVRSTISQAIGLSDLWESASRGSSWAANRLDGRQVAQLSAIDSYVTSADSRAAFRDFYQARFSTLAPVTHISTVLTIDISGSMRRKIEGDVTMVDSAIFATSDFLSAVYARSGKPYAVPENVAVFTFNSDVEHITSGFDAQAIDSVQDIVARGNTDVGKALQVSLDALADAPRSAEKRIVLLSDGMPTVGMSAQEIIDGPVADAARQGVVVDTIAFGIDDQSDRDFLESIASATGGAMYDSEDTYDLRVNFLRSRFASLGHSYNEYDVDLSEEKTVDLGSIEEGASVLEMGIVSNGETLDITFLRDGEALESDQITIFEGSDGMLSAQLRSPEMGLYTLELSGNASRAHVLVVTQAELFYSEIQGSEAQDWSTVLVVIAAVVLIVLIASAYAHSTISKRRKIALNAPEERSGIASGNEAGELGDRT